MRSRHLQTVSCKPAAKNGSDQLHLLGNTGGPSRTVCSILHCDGSSIALAFAYRETNLTDGWWKVWLRGGGDIWILWLPYPTHTLCQRQAQCTDRDGIKPKSRTNPQAYKSTTSPQPNRAVRITRCILDSMHPGSHASRIPCFSGTHTAGIAFASTLGTA